MIDKYEEQVKKQKGFLNLPLWIFSGKALVKRLKFDYEERQKMKKEFGVFKNKMEKDFVEFKGEVKKEIDKQNKRLVDLEERIKNLEK